MTQCADVARAHSQLVVVAMAVVGMLAGAMEGVEDDMRERRSRSSPCHSHSRLPDLQDHHPHRCC
eukprot:scaffold17802_cov35-Tisochrysis_lutea.AAC.5